MGTITADRLLDRARRILQDVSNASQRWTDADLLDGLNEGQRVLVTLKPDAFTAVSSVALADDSRQELPTDAVSLIRVIRNMGGDGATPGRAITLTPIHDLDDFEPDWHNASGSEVLHYMVDAEDNTGFYVYPRVAGGHIEIKYSKVPDQVTTQTSPISVADIYDAALVQYICYSALSSDMDAVANMTLAKEFFNQFVGLVTGKIQAEDQVDPNGRQ
mgnify:CR=1 FL=1